MQDDAVHEPAEADAEQDAREPRACCGLVGYVNVTAITAGLSPLRYDHGRAPFVRIPI
jgi:hypothetical protein